jgi:hypothetical protein
MNRYVYNILIGLDQLVNAVTGGDPDMTLSGRMGRAVSEGRCKLCGLICWLLGLIDKDHCAVAAKHEADEGADETVAL